MDDAGPMPGLDPAASLLAAMDEAADGTLRLPRDQPGRPVLRGVRLSAESLRERTAASDTPPRWWKAGAPSLRQAELGGSDLPDADFSGADLTGADFADVAMRSGRLGGARLEGASFAGADLSSTDFTGVHASEADFTGALLEDARFAGAVLRHANLTEALLDGADLKGADLWAARLDRAEANDAKMQGAVLHEASLQGADLTGADLSAAELKKANLRGAKLRGADLRGAILVRADLGGADLAGASLARVDLSSCNLDGVHLAGAWLQSTRLSVAQLGAGLGEEASGDFAAARQGYLALEQNFRGIGDPEAARWCYLRARRMGKRHAWTRFRASVADRAWRQVPIGFAAWLGDAFAEWLCDYGESLPRVLRAFTVTLLCFALFYGLSGTLVYTLEAGASYAGLPTRNVWQLLGFSFLNMCTTGIPDIGVKPGNHLIYFISSLQYVVGLVLIGLFGYVLGNRIRR